MGKKLWQWCAAILEYGDLGLLSLLQPFIGVITHGGLCRRSAAFFGAITKPDDPEPYPGVEPFRAIPGLRKAWVQAHIRLLKPIARTTSRREQIIQLRKAIVQTLEDSIDAGVFLAEVTEDDQKILAVRLFPNEAFEAVVAFEIRKYAFARVSCGCLRAIALDLGDTAENDWFIVYLTQYKKLSKSIDDAMIAEGKGQEPDLLAAALTVTWKAVVDSTKERIFQGYNWNLDKEAMEGLTAAEPPERGYE